MPLFEFLKNRYISANAMKTSQVKYIFALALGEMYPAGLRRSWGQLPYVSPFFVLLQYQNKCK